MKRNVYKLSGYELSEIEQAYANGQADSTPAQNEDVILDACIEVCRERARLYVMPAQWIAKRNKDNSVTVTRFHN